MEPTEELDIDITASALLMWQTILGPGVAIVPGTASFDGDFRSSGIWQNGDADSTQLTPADTGVILSTGQVGDITNESGEQNQVPNTTTNTFGDNGDPDFDVAAGGPTFDAAILEADIVTAESLLSIQFTFASEEYPEFVGSIFNDFVGVWVNDTLVTSPIFTNVQINSLNQDENETLFIDNTNDDFNTEADGLTVTLSLTIPVIPNVPNSLKIGIADVADPNFDSAVLIAANSIQGQFLARDDTLTALEGVTKTIDVLANDDAVATSVVTHLNGQDVSAGDSITLVSGHVITLNMDGTLTVVPPASQVGLTDPESVNFTYTASDGASPDGHRLCHGHRDSLFCRRHIDPDGGWRRPDRAVGQGRPDRDPR